MNRPITELYDKVRNVLPHLEGWCTEQKACHLAECVVQLRPTTVVEIGVYGGKSLIPMALACEHVGSGKVIGIDPWSKEAALEGTNHKGNDDWWATLDIEQIYNNFINKVEAFQLKHRVLIMRTTAAKAAPSIHNIDVLHIDGNHSEEMSTQDVMIYLPKVRQSGFVIFDDVNWNTTGAAQQMIEKACRVVVKTPTYALYQKNHDL